MHALGRDELAQCRVVRRVRFSLGSEDLSDRREADEIGRQLVAREDGGQAPVGHLVAHEQAPLARKLTRGEPAHSPAPGEGGDDEDRAERERLAFAHRPVDEDPVAQPDPQHEQQAELRQVGQLVGCRLADPVVVAAVEPKGSWPRPQWQGTPATSGD